MHRQIGPRAAGFAALTLLGFVTAGCGASTAAEDPAMSGRRVHGATVVAHGEVPYRVGAYELVFEGQPGMAQHTGRAALLVDLLGDRGRVQGFAEWGRPGEPPRTYAVGRVGATSGRRRRARNRVRSDHELSPTATARRAGHGGGAYGSHFGRSGRRP
jgi:hypothetical protein